MYAAWASILVRAALGLRDGLELEFLWASTLEIRTESTSGLLLDLNTLDGLVGLHAILHPCPYPWMSSSHHPPLLDEKPSSASIVLEGDPAQHEGKRGCQNNRNGQYYEIDYDHIFEVAAHLGLQTCNRLDRNAHDLCQNQPAKD